MTIVDLSLDKGSKILVCIGMKSLALPQILLISGDSLDENMRHRSGVIDVQGHSWKKGCEL